MVESLEPWVKIQENPANPSKDSSKHNMYLDLVYILGSIARYSPPWGSFPAPVQQGRHPTGTLQRETYTLNATTRPTPF